MSSSSTTPISAAAVRNGSAVVSGTTPPGPRARAARRTNGTGESPSRRAGRPRRGPGRAGRVRAAAPRRGPRRRPRAARRASVELLETGYRPDRHEQSPARSWSAGRGEGTTSSRGRSRRSSSRSASGPACRRGRGRRRAGRWAAGGLSPGTSRRGRRIAGVSKGHGLGDRVGLLRARRTLRARSGSRRSYTAISAPPSRWTTMPSSSPERVLSSYRTPTPGSSSSSSTRDRRRCGIRARRPAARRGVPAAPGELVELGPAGEAVREHHGAVRSRTAEQLCSAIATKMARWPCSTPIAGPARSSRRAGVTVAPARLSSCASADHPMTEAKRQGGCSTIRPKPRRCSIPR